MKTAMLLLVFSLLFLSCSAPTPPQESGCVTCHTDAAVLKSLFVPSKIEGGGCSGASPPAQAEEIYG